MSQNSYILNPWILSLTTVLFVGAAYSVQFFQWNSLNTLQTQPNQIIAMTAQPPVVSVSTFRPAYFSTHLESSDKHTHHNEKLISNPDSGNDLGSKQTVQSHPDHSFAAQSVKKDEIKNEAIDEKVISFKSTPNIHTVHKETLASELDQPKVLPHQESETKSLNVSEKPSQPSIDELLRALVVVEYPDEVVLEFEQALFPENFMQRLLARFILSPEPMDNYALLQSTLNKSPFRLREQPHYFQQILGSSKQPIRYPAQAYAYAEKLLKTNRSVVVDQDNTYVQVSIPLHSLLDLTKLNVDQSKTSPAGKELPFANFVNRFSREFSVDKELIYAIMEVESAFNPKAVSKSNALGLMQIKANSAGKDVYQYIDGKNIAPSKEVLFNPKENIRIGTAYLKLLDEFYFADVADKDKRELLAIASYNGGLNTVLKLFGKTSEQAIERINGLSQQSILQRLIYQHPSEETRNYIQKVNRAKQNYRKAFS